MLYVPIDKIKPGMVVARPICHSRSGVHYVQKGYELDARTITRLKDLGVVSLWAECGNLPQVNEKINEKVLDQRRELDQTLNHSLDQLRNRTDAIIDCSHFEEKVGSLLNEVLEDPTHQPLLVAMGEDCHSLARHLTNCCYLCLLLGTHLSGYVRHQRRKMPHYIAEDIRHLGMGAFIHDLGKAHLLDETQKTHILNADPEDKAYLAHTRIGYELVRGQVSSLAAYMVVHHHQRFDGKGFPKVKARNPKSRAAGVAGEKIHIFARILSIADVFDHLLGTPDEPMPTIYALHALQQPRFNGWFDPIVLAALNRLMPPFMLGSVVTLTDGSSAVVVDNHSSAPCHPIVRIITGEPGTPGSTVSDKDINLRTHPSLDVCQVDGVDVQPYFYDPPDISDGVMAYWGLRRKAAKAVTVDSFAIAPESEPLTPTPP
ncbi:MAG: HD domain-containing protein [Phycisphaerae bacterium]|nr:HD domain-containing protein [Phycisphaerae bacterium]